MKSSNCKLCSIASFMLQAVYFNELEYFQQGYVWVPLPWKQTYLPIKFFLYSVRGNTVLTVEPSFIIF